MRYLSNIRQGATRYIWSYDPGNPLMAKSSWRHSLQIMAMVFRDLSSGMLSLRATSLVYTTLLSIIPVLAVSLVVLKGVGMHDQLEPGLHKLLAPLGEQSLLISAQIITFLKNMNYGILGLLGVGLLIFNVFSLILKVESAFNDTWRVRSNRPLLKRFSYYLVVLLVGPVLVFSTVGITVSLGSNAILTRLEALPYIGEVISLTGRGLPYVLVTCAFCFIYLLVPNTRVRFRSAFFGALTTGFLWASLSLLFASFVSGSTHYTAIYSGFAIMLVFMIWLYLSWLILLVGASIAYHHQHPKQMIWRNDALNLNASRYEQLVLQTMVSLGRAYEKQIEMIPTLDKLAASQQVSVELLERVLNSLEADGLVYRSNDDPPHYLPARSSERIRLIEILRGFGTMDEDLDGPAANLLQDIDRAYDSVLGEQTLAEFLKQYSNGIHNNENKGGRDEDSLI